MKIKQYTFFVEGFPAYMKRPLGRLGRKTLKEKAGTTHLPRRVQRPRYRYSCCKKAKFKV